MLLTCAATIEGSNLVGSFYHIMTLVPGPDNANASDKSKNQTYKRCPNLGHFKMAAVGFNGTRITNYFGY